MGVFSIRFSLEGSGVSLTLYTGVTLQGVRVTVKSGAALVLKNTAEITSGTGV
jgi:hypothetical protein